MPTIHLKNRHKTFHQKGHVGGKWAREKLLNIIPHQGNAGQLYCVSLCLSERLKSKEQEPRWARTRRNGPSEWAAAPENSLTVSCKTAHLQKVAQGCAWWCHRSHTWIAAVSTRVTTLPRRTHAHVCTHKGSPKPLWHNAGLISWTRETLTLGGWAEGHRPPTHVLATSCDPN